MKDRGFEKDLAKIEINCNQCKWNGLIINYQNHFEEVHRIKDNQCPFQDIGCENSNLLNESLENHLLKNIKEHLSIIKRYVHTSITQVTNDSQLVKNEIERIKSNINDHTANFNKTERNTLNDNIESDLLQQVVSIENLKKKYEELEEKYVTKNDVNENIQKILTLTQSQVINLEQELFNQRHATYNGVLVWKITHVREKFQDAISGRQVSHYSPPFYSSQYGYKMCTRIYLNGDGVARNTHVSLFFVICKGEHDSLLKWPFKQKITFILLDQSTNESKENIVEAFRPDSNSNSFKRPTSDMNIASGIPLFCSLQKLRSNEHEYIKDDTIFIKIIVDCRDTIDI